MGGENKRRRTPNCSLALARNVAALISCFIFGLLSVKYLVARTAYPPALIRLSQPFPPSLCPPQPESACNCTEPLNQATKDVPVSVQSSDLRSESKEEGKSSETPHQPLAEVLLFVGILSGRGYRHRRLAVREAWANRCQLVGVSICRFILSEDEQTPQVCAS